MTNKMMIKIQHTAEALFIFLSITWYPIAGIILAIPGAWFYISMMKKNIIDKDHDGSWKKYFKQLFKF